MKKLLVLALVLSMATMANAGLQISVGGVQDVTEAEVTLVPSGELVLDIWTDAQIETGIGEGYFAMLASMQGGTIAGGIPAVWSILLYDDALGNGIMVPEGHNGVFGVVATPPATVFPAGMTLIDGIMFHCEGPGDVIVTLFALDGDTGELLGILDTVVVHQIPEPITMTLLGLGGLFLRRRK